MGLGYSDDIESRLDAGMGCFSDYLPGWRDIIEELNYDLSKIDPGYVIDQIKEKFAELRYYVTASGDFGDQLWERIAEAERLSLETCMDCGAPGTLRNRGGYYIFTACDNCDDKRKVRVNAQ